MSDEMFALIVGLCIWMPILYLEHREATKHERLMENFEKDDEHV